MGESDLGKSDGGVPGMQTWRTPDETKPRPVGGFDREPVVDRGDPGDPGARGLRRIEMGGARPLESSHKRTQ